tara:strand:- start:1438 stop:1767 length:330 start_codon:yes stop_codon:yes gene_type:complete
MKKNKLNKDDLLAEYTANDPIFLVQVDGYKFPSAHDLPFDDEGHAVVFRTDYESPTIPSDVTVLIDSGPNKEIVLPLLSKISAALKRRYEAMDHAMMRITEEYKNTKKE